MKLPLILTGALATCALFSGRASAQSILVLNGTASSNIQASLAAAGFNVVSGYLDHDEIANALAADPSIVEIWIWNDGTYGNTGTPADPSHDFSAADLAALDAFRVAHPHWIMDGLAWRSDTVADEQSLTMNEALDLAAAGGGIVLGADDASGGAIVQHVNQIGAHAGFTPFIGTYNITTLQQHQAGTIFAAPNVVDPTMIVSTLSFSDVPHGLQPNGLLLTTALFADNAAEDPLYPPNPPLVGETFHATPYSAVDHLVTTSLPGGGAPSHSVLVLNGNTGGSLGGVLSAAGWNVIAGTLDPGQISSNLAANPSIEEIWIWSDGTYQTYDPSRAFDAADLAALDAFSALHPQWIMDGLAWRSHTTQDEIDLSVNEAAVLAAAGGGIVLGGDDDYDPFVLQHVNQVAAHAGFDLWFGVYLVGPGNAHATGTDDEHAFPDGSDERELHDVAASRLAWRAAERTLPRDGAVLRFRRRLSGIHESAAPGRSHRRRTPSRRRSADHDDDPERRLPRQHGRAVLLRRRLRSSLSVRELRRRGQRLREFARHRRRSLDGGRHAERECRRLRDRWSRHVGQRIGALLPRLGGTERRARCDVRRRSALRGRIGQAPRHAPEFERCIRLWRPARRHADLGEGRDPRERGHALLPGVVPQRGIVLHVEPIQLDERNRGDVGPVITAFLR
jgi:hypothetical protein